MGFSVPEGRRDGPGSTGAGRYRNTVGLLVAAGLTARCRQGRPDWRSLIRALMASAMALSFRAEAKPRAFW